MKGRVFEIGQVYITKAGGPAYKCVDVDVVLTRTISKAGLRKPKRTREQIPLFVKCPVTAASAPAHPLPVHMQNALIAMKEIQKAIERKEQ